MSHASQQARALIDLGLLSRVVCHELNNQVANQRGYTRLLLQRGGNGSDAQRWLAELAASGESLHKLIARLQLWSRQTVSDGAAETPACAWPPAPQLDALTAQLAAQQCALGEVALLRILGIVAGLAGASAHDWSAPRCGPPPAHGATLGTAAGSDMLGLRLIDRSDGREALAWGAAADHILPPDGAGSDDWLRALVLGLLRQSGGDLFHAPGGAGELELWLPRSASDLENA